MPIYEYICRSCGFEKEHLQKMSDAPIAQCPDCGSHEYVKLVSAAGFQLKGSGWYVTDFRNKPTPKSEAQTKPNTSAADNTTTTSEKTATPTSSTGTTE